MDRRKDPGRTPLAGRARSGLLEPATAECDVAAQEATLGTEGKQMEKESQQLARMEQTAQATDNPAVIKREEAPRGRANAADYTWLLALAGFVAALFGAQVLLNFHPQWLPDPMLPRVRGYIRGAML